MTVRLVCPHCRAGLVPSWSGLLCPRLGSCGRGGVVEDGATLRPFGSLHAVPSGVRA